MCPHNRTVEGDVIYGVCASPSGRLRESRRVIDDLTSSPPGNEAAVMSLRIGEKEVLRMDGVCDLFTVIR